MKCNCLCLATAVMLAAVCHGDERAFVSSPRLSIGTQSNRSASVRAADLDGDKNIDLVVANGRHWPQQNFVFMNQGRSRFNVQRLLGTDRCTSYATELADLDGDGDVDVAVGNDMAPNRVFLNDGSGNFESAGTFGTNSSVRSLMVVDLDKDGDVDVIATSRGRANQIYLNNGKGKFDSGRPFGTRNDSTIDVATIDWNHDGHLDLVLANRDSQPNAILINDGELKFSKRVPFGSGKDQTRAVAVGDVDGDGEPDIAAGNIGQANAVHLSDGKGGVRATITFGLATGRTYTLAMADMDNDKDLDLIVGNAGQTNAVFFNSGDGKTFKEVRFGGPANATYGLDVADFDGDGFADIAVANSDAPNAVFLNRPPRGSTRRQATPRPRASTAPQEMAPVGTKKSVASKAATDWPSFRGAGAKGVSGGSVRTKWNADKAAGDVAGVLWQTEVPGLGHSSPVVSGDRIYLVTAISAEGDAPLMVGRGGKPTAAADNGEQSWVVLCYNRLTGDELWRKTARKGKPRATRHAKATHANTSVAIDGDNVVAFLGSEGIYCYDLDGKLKWERDLGVINISKYGIGWGFASSPAIHGDHIAIVCDDPEKPFAAALRLSDGEEVWRTSRKDICERSWGTPFIHSSGDRDQVVVNGWPWIVSYDLKNGEELWRIKGGGDNPVPTPFEANGWIYITNAHGAQSPIFVVKPDATGDVTPPKDSGKNDSIVWSVRRGGSYMSTPVVYGDYLYLGNSNGVVRCFHALTGEKVYEERLGAAAGIIASLVAADGKIFCASENGTVYVLKAGSDFEVLATNKMGSPCFATPAIIDGVVYIRTTESLVAVK